MHDVSLAFPKSVPIVSAFVANNSIHIAGDFLLHFEVRIDWIRFGLSVGLTFGKGKYERRHQTKLENDKQGRTWAIRL